MENAHFISFHFLCMYICAQFYLMKLFRCRIFLLLSCILLNKFSTAQLFHPKNYPQHYFQWPVGARIGLVANFGELRPNHYHMGLDIRTDQRVNVPVYAAADGYIAKVKIEPFGFGRCIYINHPNGFTTLYAHLNNFNPALEKYITDQQYLLKKWEVFLDIPAELFPVKKGDFIAYSGSTGGSQGPHVHFEIRDTQSDKVFNPLLFGFPIPDDVAPNVLRLAVYDRRFSTYEQVPKIYPLKRINGIYTVIGGKISLNTDKVSFAINAVDRYSGSANPNGIYSAEIFDNDIDICGFEMNNISYDETRYLNAHIDYKTRSRGGPFLQHLSRLPGYNDGIYKTTGNDGVIRLDDSSTHKIKIIVSDVYNNKSVIGFSLKANSINEIKNDLSPDKIFYPNAVNIFEKDDLSFYLPETALYDSFHFIYNEINSNTGMPVYQLHNPSVPVHNNFPIKIRHNFPVSDTGYVVMKRSSGTKQDYKKAVFENGWYKASFRDFGNYQLLVDHIPPTITPVGFRNGMNAARSNRIAFIVSDNTEEIINFTALLDGNWLRFTNDKGKTFIYLFDGHCGRGEHELKIRVEDLVGNVTEKVFRFTR